MFGELFAAVMAANVLSAWLIFGMIRATHTADRITILSIIAPLGFLGMGLAHLSAF